jgi:hypothetical protein
MVYWACPICFTWMVLEKEAFWALYPCSCNDGLIGWGSCWPRSGYPELFYLPRLHAFRFGSRRL